MSCNNGNQLSFKITDNGSVTLNESYAYDKTNQVSSITAADVTANFTYDNNGNMLTYKRNSITTAYTYNEGNMPVSVRTYKGSNYENDTITYYLNGNKKTTKDINNNTTTYVYDGMGRLSSEQETNGYSAVYSYDNYGNRIGKTVNDGDNSHNICYTYDKNNHLITETKDVQGGQEINRYFYDANGNQTYRNEEKITLSTQKDYSVKLNSGGHGTSYEYDGLNRLIRADDGTNVSAYTYDGNNLRQSKTVNGVTTRHIYNGMNVVQEKEANKLKVTYHRAGNQIIYSDVQGSKNFYIYNAQGNVSKLLNAAGETVADYTFDAFGVQKSVSGNVYNPFRHNGEYYDDELGYTYLRNRYYDNNIGRFITEDPVKDGLNWYSYCENNPIMFTDPSGLRGTMLRYAVEKNRGRVLYDEATGIATAKIGNITKEYKGQIINGRMIVDSAQLESDFGLDESNFIHGEKDFFDTEQDAALAMALTYNPESINKTGDEIAAYIYKLSNNMGGYYYQFDGVVHGYSVNPNNRGVALGSIEPLLGRKAVAWFHTHGPYNVDPAVDENQKQWDLFTDWIVDTDPITGSTSDRGDAVYSKDIDLNAYLANPAGELKYYDRSLYVPQEHNFHVPEPHPSVTIIASGIPQNL